MSLDGFLNRLEAHDRTPSDVQPDVALTKALGLPEHRGREAQREAERRSQAWRPWRSYAVIRAWAGAANSQPASPPMENTA